MNKQELTHILKKINEDLMNIRLYDVLHIIKKDNITYDKNGDTELYNTLSDIKHNLRYNNSVLMDINKYLYGMFAKNMTEDQEIFATLYFISYYFTDVYNKMSSVELYEIQDIKEIETFIISLKSRVGFIEKYINKWKEKKESVKNNMEQ